MKKNKCDIARLKNIIDLDRLSSEEDFNKLIIKDLNKVLSDYFDYRESPSLEILKEGGEFKVLISFTAVNLKRFSLLTKN